ncbi:MAG: IS110 family transposase [Deltaproteobacteria bacterium]|nr:IS110 family transposase [Deltaproteobacteria bacterium]
MSEVTTTIPEQTIGLDLGDRTTHGCTLDAAGEVISRFRVATTHQGLAKAMRGWPTCRVVLEVGTHSPWMSRALAAAGHEVIVANPRAVQSVTQSSRKNDAADAEQLARLGRSDPKLLHPIQHRGEAVQRDRALLAVRRKLVESRGSLVVQARGLAKGLGVRLPKATTAGFCLRVREAKLEELFPGLEALLRTIDQLNHEIQGLDRALLETSREQYPETALLRQVPGVGPVTALTYVLTIEDPERFAKSRTVGSYLGLRPKQRDSGNQRPQLSISKEGDRELRSLLVECSQWILARGSESDLKHFGEHLVQRGGKAAKKKALVAMARKLSVLLHHLWRTGEVYEPLHLQARAA